MPQVKPFAKIHTAAAYFAFISRNIREIAEHFDVSDRTIRRWASDEEWDAALDACLYTGDRTFETQPRRDTQRENPDTFAEAETVYQAAIARSEPRHKVASLTSRETGVPIRKIWEWARKFNWREESEE